MSVGEPVIDVLFSEAEIAARVETLAGEIAGAQNGELLIVQSNGGVMSADTARTLPVRTALSAG